MKITLLDAATLGEGLDFSVLDRFGEVEIYEKTPQQQVAERILDTDVVIINKIKMNEESLRLADNLKLICVFATGFDNIDTDYCREKGIAVCNVKGYSTDSVAQLTVALVLELVNRMPEFKNYVLSGDYSKSGVQNYLKPQFHELSGKTWGIIGCGAIGSRVAKIAQAFGCNVIVNKRNPHRVYKNATVEEICSESDIITIHAPLNEKTRGLLNREKISKMKKSAILVNVARGAITDEEAIAEAIEKGELSGFGADVYSTEPFSENHPFTRIMHRDNVCLTPHMAWAALEARKRCLDEIILNIEAFLKGEKRNRVEI